MTKEQNLGDDFKHLDASIEYFNIFLCDKGFNPLKKIFRRSPVHPTCIVPSTCHEDKCNNCINTLNNRHTFKTHVNSCHGHKCNNCNNTLNNRHTFKKKHVNSCHGDKCNSCNNTYFK